MSDEYEKIASCLLACEECALRTSGGIYFIGVPFGAP